VANPTGAGSTLLTLGNLAALANSVTFNGNGAATFAGSTVTVTGASTITNNSFGATALNLGNLSVAGVTLTTTGAGSFLVSGTTAQTVSGGITHTGLGTLTIGTGNITLTAGVTQTLAAKLDRQHQRYGSISNFHRRGDGEQHRAGRDDPFREQPPNRQPPR